MLFFSYRLRKISPKCAFPRNTNQELTWVFIPFNALHRDVDRFYKSQYTYMESTFAALSAHVPVRLCSDLARMPTRRSALSAGYDLHAALQPGTSITLRPHGKALIPTDVALDLSALNGVYARIAPRSGLAWRAHLHVGAGVVDADYRGSIGVVIYNLSPTDEFEISSGDRVAQMILERYVEDVHLAATPRAFSVSARGNDGFGSTGVAATDLSHCASGSPVPCGQ